MTLAMMNSHPCVFSIVTITRNNLDGFAKTHKSINGQICKDFEWIIVDGASTDGTLDYIRNNNLESLCISEPDKGIYSAMNKGIDRAKGDYLLFLNAGDSLADIDILSTLAMAINKHHPDFIYGDSLEECKSARPYYKKARNHKNFIWGMFTHHQAMLYRRAALNNLRYNEEYKIASDYEFTVRFLQKIHRIHYIPCAICFLNEVEYPKKTTPLDEKNKWI